MEPSELSGCHVAVERLLKLKPEDENEPERGARQERGGGEGEVSAVRGVSGSWAGQGRVATVCRGSKVCSCCVRAVVVEAR